MISQGIEIRYIRDRDGQMRIAKACHADPTSGHLGFRKTLASIIERFTWKGVSKDAKKIVCAHAHTHIHTHMHTVHFWPYRSSAVMPANM